MEDLTSSDSPAGDEASDLGVTEAGKGQGNKKEQSNSAAEIRKRVEVTPPGQTSSSDSAPSDMPEMED